MYFSNSIFSGAKRHSLHLELTHPDKNLKEIQKSDRQNKALQSLSFVQLVLVLRQLLLHALPLFSQPQAALAC